ncbi:MAG: glutamine amidotransferase [Phycisphaerae bacterium]
MSLVFKSFGWQNLLTAAAIGLLCLETLMLLLNQLRQREPVPAVFITVAALLAGPIVAISALLYGALTAGNRGRLQGRRVVLAGLRGTLILLLALLTWWSAAAGNSVGLLTAIAVCGVFWAIRSYSRTTARVKSRAKGMLLALRIAVILLLALWAARPALEYRTWRSVRGVLLIGVDASRSMQQKDVPPDYTQTQPTTDRGAISRYDAARRAIYDHRQKLLELAETNDIQFFAFSDDPVETALLTRDRQTGRTIGWGDSLLPPQADGRSTAIGDAVHAAFDPRLAGEQPVSAIILLSDGNNNAANPRSPEGLAKLMASHSVPIYGVAVGSDTISPATRSLSVRDLTVPRTVNAFNRFNASGRLQALGLVGRQVKVVSRFGEKIVAEEVIDINEPNFSRDLKYTHVPVKTGFQQLSVTAELVGDRPEDMAGQPTAKQLVQVVDRTTRVLYVEGKFRYESKYIYQALQAAERFTVTRKVLIQPLRQDDVPTFGQTLEDWIGYHAIIFGDVDETYFTPKQLQIIQTLVDEYGKGFCMLGGSKSFGAGQWEDTPIAKLLPVDVSRSGGQIDRDITIVPSEQALDHPLLQIGKSGESAEDAWAKLPQMPGANRLAGVKPAAEVLATDTEDNPMIVAQPYGSGRSLAIAFDTTWRWVLTPKDTQEYQKRFWRQVVLHLADPQGNVWISSDKSVYDLGRLNRAAETIQIEAGVEDPRGRPVTDQPVTVTLTGPDGQTRPIELRVSGAKRVGRATPPDQPGTYSLKISAEVAGQTLTAEHRFEVKYVDLESQEVLANLELMRELAAMTEGEYARIADFGQMLEELKVSAQPKKRLDVTHAELSVQWRWPVLIALFVLACAEWALRKRKGLV